MIYIKPGNIEGRITAPSSKSAMQRYLAASCLSDYSLTLRYSSGCDDIDTAVQVIADLGCRLEKDNNDIAVYPRSAEHNTSLQCNESGLCLRMFAPVVSLFANCYLLHAKGSLLKRPVHFIESPLKKLGAKVLTDNGYPPLKICGPIRGGSVMIDGSITSQFLTGLLIALPCCPYDSEIYVKKLNSRPYISLTVSILEEFGIVLDYEKDYSYFKVKGNQKFRPVFRVKEIEGDWSSISFFLVAGAVSGIVRVDNINMESKQGDKAILDVLRNAGALVSVSEEAITVEKSVLRSFEFNASDCPDLFPPLTALALSCTGISKIHGIKRLIHKESNRARTLVDAFRNIGASIEEKGECLEIKGGIIQGGVSHSYGDHRIAMSLAVAGLNSKEGVRIDNHHVVSKSFRDFFRLLKKVYKEKI